MKTAMRKESTGAALVISLLLLMVSTVLGISGLNGALMGERIAGNHKQASDALMAAETAISRAVAWLDSNPDHHSDDGGYWILETDEPAAADAKAAAMIGAIAHGGTRIREGISWSIESVMLTRPDELRITGLGVVEETGTTRRIAVLYARPHRNAPAVPEAEAAYTCFGAGCQLIASGSAFIDGHDWNLPAGFDCEADKCSGARHDHGSDSAVAGVFLPDNGSITGADISGQSNAEKGFAGDPATLVTSSYTGNYGVAYWSEYVAGLESAATVNGVFSSGGFGTRDQVQVTEISASTRLHGSVRGAGVLVVRENAALELSGTFHFEGLIVVEAGATVSTNGGSVTIFGAIVALDGNPSAIDADFSGAISVKYSSTALSRIAAIAPRTIPSSVTAWQELQACTACAGFAPPDLST